MIKYLSDKQSSMQGFFSYLGLEAFKIYQRFTVGLILHNNVRVMHT